MHGEQIYFSDQNLRPDNPDQYLEGTNVHFQHLFKTFISNFSRENVRVYYKQIITAFQQGKYQFSLELSDLKANDEALYDKFTSNPLEMLTVMEESLKSYVKERAQEFPNCNLQANWHVIIKSNENPKKLRSVTSSMVSKIVVISGIIISCTKPYIKASKLKLKCRNCGLARTVELQPGQYPYVPSFCPGQNGVNQKCPHDPYVAMPDSEVIDVQNMKIQENPEEIPVGQIARTYPLIAAKENVGRCVPGDRVRITGIMLVHDLKTNDNLSKGCIYVTGIEKLKERSNIQYTQQDEEIFKKMSKDPKIYEKIHKSIAPGIYGNEEIKKAIACMLFGGARKHLPDQTILRGDINILLMGDPSTAKSQFLKFVEQTASIAIYTSGKGSSAAGLTASITKDNSTGEFQIEGGALVLADGGIVCIDQFDKMKAPDRVAIHEAMEQQTISVAKAGITTRLNSRTSILAAANPIHGRYNDLKDITEQIAFQTTILSRFDCIFVVRDLNTDETNQRMAEHILGLHQGRIQKDADVHIPFELLKKYISYARNKLFPRLSHTASEKLQNIYIADRQKAKEHKVLNQNSIPITVRQLEAIIRLSESLAKMKLKTQVSGDEVDEAHYLFETSTMKTIEGKEFGMELPQNVIGEVQRIQEAIRKRVCVGNVVNFMTLTDDLDAFYPTNLINHAIVNMCKNGELRETKGRKQLIREK